MAEHKYAQALRWLAEGKDVEVRWGSRPEWLPLSMRNEVVNDEIVQGRGHYQFRLKPRTVKIGSREVEAPVLEPGAGQKVWYSRVGGAAFSFLFDPQLDCHRVMAAEGRVFASPEACESASDAYTALLRGDA